ncbi:hypothetical protein BASA50_005165 [Batrachochytrium salamandrivorans]|uniref:CCDC66 domain-containing protein n=1 Tax=Batrachochytrium salamandrivorans TaxID=1357716 RepID=A0ABQ8FDM3_9FUNG|nr:hypothetical protein BASA50_005165 [Batrachochytrium salamandrivorans]
MGNNLPRNVEYAHQQNHQHNQYHRNADHHSNLHDHTHYPMDFTHAKASYAADLDRQTVEKRAQRYQDREAHHTSGHIRQSDISQKSQYLKDLDDQIRYKKEMVDRQKKLQMISDLKKEKEMKEYNPFGRSGAGAPPQLSQTASVSTGRRMFPNQHASQTSSGVHQNRNSTSNSPCLENHINEAQHCTNFTQNQQEHSIDNIQSHIDKFQSDSPHQLHHQRDSNDLGLGWNGREMQPTPCNASSPLLQSSLTGTVSPTHQKVSVNTNGEKSFIRGLTSVDTLPLWQREDLARKQKMQQETQDALLHQIAEKEAERARKEALRRQEDEKEQARLVKEQDHLRKKYARENQEAREKEEKTILENAQLHGKKSLNPLTLDQSDEKSVPQTSQQWTEKTTHSQTQSHQSESEVARYDINNKTTPHNNVKQPPAIVEKSAITSHTRHVYQSQSPPIPVVLKKMRLAEQIQKKESQDAHASPVENVHAKTQSSSLVDHRDNLVKKLPSFSRTEQADVVENETQTRPRSSLLTKTSPPLLTNATEGKYLPLKKNRLMESNSDSFERFALLDQLSAIQKELANEDKKIRQDLQSSKDTPQFKSNVSENTFLNSRANHGSPHTRDDRDLYTNLEVPNVNPISTHMSNTPEIPVDHRQHKDVPIYKDRSKSPLDGYYISQPKRWNTPTILHPTPIRAINPNNSFEQRLLESSESITSRLNNDKSPTSLGDWFKYLTLKDAESDSMNLKDGRDMSKELTLNTIPPIYSHHGGIENHIHPAIPMYIYLNMKKVQTTRYTDQLNLKEIPKKAYTQNPLSRNSSNKSQYFPRSGSHGQSTTDLFNSASGAHQNAIIDSLNIPSVSDSQPKTLSQDTLDIAEIERINKGRLQRLIQLEAQTPGSSYSNDCSHNDILQKLTCRRETTYDFRNYEDESSIPSTPSVFKPLGASKD